MRIVFCAIWAMLFLGVGMFDGVRAGENKEPAKGKGGEGKQNKDPLSKFKADDLVKIDFCFTQFVAALGAGDADVVKAFLAEVPANLAKLDLKKEEDRKTFLQAYASLKGAQITASSRFSGGLAQVKYARADGTEGGIRMQNVGGCWKIAGE